jgi:cation transport protein ChaC
MNNRRMTLTADLVAQVHRIVSDAGPLPGLSYQTEDDYDCAVQETLATHTLGDDAWVFAYGSLIWKPEVEHIEERCGIARGWHRSFCYTVTRFRGTRDLPGLMMALDRGGQCGGVLYRLRADTLREQLGKLFRREFTVKPANTLPRWISVATDKGRLRAIAFVINRKAQAYVGRITLEETAEILTKACGHWGSGVEYLYNTVYQLEEHGVHDRNLWQLQLLVAASLISHRVAESDPENSGFNEASRR